MNSSLTFARQRVAILAPHPDDESLATGGLIQRAVKEGAEVRVVFVTDGENNPWPQRFLEGRWRIGQEERQRWGTRRREEALAAMRCLGLSEEHAHFLGLPDQGATTALLHAQERPIAAFAKALAEWRPTLLVAPSLHDIHPDHNALAMLVNLALTRLPDGPDIRLIHYLVHTRKQGLPAPCWTLHLSAREKAIKRQAILKHGSQIALSGRRFLAYARDTEHFYPPDAIDRSHPVRDAGIENGALRVRIQPSRAPAGDGELFVAFESALHGSVRWRVPVRRRSGIARIRDAATGHLLRNATVRSTGGVLEVRLPLSPVLPVRSIAVKFNRRIAFYDEAGWLDVTASRSEAGLDSERSSTAETSLERVTAD